MPRLIIRVVGTALLTLVLACSDEPEWRELPLSPGQSYRVQLRTFKDGDHLDHPFEIRLATHDDASRGATMLISNQCKDVNLVPLADRIYVFYDRIGLRHFTNMYYDNLPRPVMCDIAIEQCRYTLAQLKGEGHQVYPVCTSR